MPRNPHGAISIHAPAGRLRIQFPRRWYGGKQKYLTLHLPDTSDNRLWAANLVRRIEWDYLQGDFDSSLAKYLKTPLQNGRGLKLAQLWGEYCQYKSRSLKPASMHYLVSILGHHITRCPHQDIDKALGVRLWLLDRTTAGMTRRVLAALTTAISWALRHKQLPATQNLFIGMAEEIRVDKSSAQANAFSALEREQIITAFEQSHYYHHYAPLVRFWFLTGCRPSEGIGLEWEQIDPDCSRIVFDRSIVKVGNANVKNRLSKNNRKRTFSCQPELQQFLSDRRTSRNSKISLVFPSLEGKPIDYINFSHRAWDKIVDQIVDRPTTPYSCRDTFITDQIGKGVAPAIVAKWVDNSVEMIEKYYLDISAIDHIKPR